jgi:hypothetical protein
MQAQCSNPSIHTSQRLVRGLCVHGQCIINKTLSIWPHALNQRLTRRLLAAWRRCHRSWPLLCRLWWGAYWRSPWLGAAKWESNHRHSRWSKEDQVVTQQYGFASFIYSMVSHYNIAAEATPAHAGIKFSNSKRSTTVTPRAFARRPTLVLSNASPTSGSSHAKPSLEESPTPSCSTGVDTASNVSNILRLLEAGQGIRLMDYWSNVEGVENISLQCSSRLTSSLVPLSLRSRIMSTIS